MRTKIRKLPMYSPKRRALMEQGEKINYTEVYEAYDWICYLCQVPINPDLRHPNDWAGTIDHVVPLSKGGKHVWDNLKPAHALCNFKKGDSLTTEIKIDTMVS